MKTLFTLVFSVLLLANVASAQVVGIRDIVPGGCLEADNPKEVAELLSQGRMDSARAKAQEGIQDQLCGPIGLPGELTKIVATYGDYSVVEFTIKMRDENDREASLQVYTIVKVKTDDI
jgi:hypothetical protein